MPRKAFLSDINDELINTYEVVRDNVEGLIRELRKHRHDEEYFYQVRNWDRLEDYLELSPARRASRFIFLNKTCFNGLHRVNSKGFFNVPFGDYANPSILDAANLRRCSAVLKGSIIRKASYLSVEASAKSGDFVYFDPPYAPLSATSSFTSYTSSGFSSADQEQLRDLCVRLDRKGVFFMLSNSSAPLILDLYNSFNLSLVDAKRSINSKGNGRGAVKEVIVTNY
jgi:DNA adenine methylase